MDTFNCDIKQPNDDLPPMGVRIQRNRNTLPKARQKAGPPPEEVFTGEAPSRTVSGENINTQVFYNRNRSYQRKDRPNRNSAEYYSNSSLNFQC